MVARVPNETMVVGEGKEANVTTHALESLPCGNSISDRELPG